MSEQIDDAVIEKIQKLLNLAAKNSNEAEAASAAAKAQELLAKYNLSTAALERASGSSGKRQQEEVEGGFYRYQRELWKEVARLNFCFHWVQKKFVPREERVRKVRYKRRHVLVGRVANVRATVAMANYLLASIERVTREVCEEKKVGHLSGWAMSFREGCAYRLTTRLEERRQEIIDAEEKAEKEAWERASKAGVSHSTELTIAGHSQNERDLNQDFVNGDDPGTAARERAESAARRRQREEEHTRWAAANPEEARAQEEKRQKEYDERVRKASRRGGSRDTRYDHVDRQAFWAGDARAKEIGLDQQASHQGSKARRIG